MLFNTLLQYSLNPTKEVDVVVVEVEVVAVGEEVVLEAGEDAEVVEVQ